MRLHAKRDQVLSTSRVVLVRVNHKGILEFHASLGFGEILDPGVHDK
jgi:hypothetical protein